MKTVNKIAVGTACCAVFLTMAAFGLNIKIETKPQPAQAAACTNPVTNIKDMSGITKIAIWEQSAGPAAVPAAKYEYAVTDGRLSAPVSGCMFNTGFECYNTFFSDANGTANANGGYITTTVWVSTGAGNGQNAGGNIDAVGLYVNNQWIYADNVSKISGTGGYSDGLPNNALGAPNSAGLSGITFFAGRLTSGSITVGFCNPNTTPACNTNADCGTNSFTGALTCQNNDVYQSYKTYTCNNPGTATSYCSNASVSQLKQMCAAAQACNTGGCFPETW